MLGTLDRSSKDVTIVGAGIAGMLAAYELDRQGYRVELLEGAAHGGGLLGSEQTPFGLVERAAHSFLLSENLEELCRELGLELVKARPEARARFVLRKGRMRRFPLTVLETVRLVWRVVFRRARVEECGTSLADWGQRHLGAAATENLLAPFLRGIFAAPPEDLSLSAASPQLAVPPRSTLLGTLLRLRRERKKSGAKRATMHAPRDGMTALARALEGRLEQRLGERFRRGVRVGELPTSPNLILALPASEAGALLGKAAPELAAKLCAVEYSPMVSVTVFAKAECFKRRPKGVGVLASPGETGRVLGLLFNSSTFEGRVIEHASTAGSIKEGTTQMVSLTAMLGGAGDPGALGLSDEEIKQEIRAVLEKLFDFKGEIAHLAINRHSRAIPKYSRALEHTWAVALEGWCAHPGHILFGNYTGQLSLRGMVETAATRLSLSARQ